MVSTIIRFLVICMLIYFQRHVFHLQANAVSVDELSYHVDKTLQGCTNGVILNSTTGNISSPNYPQHYNNYLMCNWTVISPPGKAIRVTFVDQEIENDGSCQYDHLIIYLENQTFGGRKYCGSEKPRNFVSQADTTINFVFKSDSADTARGFFLTWNFQDACSTSNFTCWNGDCVPISKHCDATGDCTDDSDEIECAYNSSSTNPQCGSPTVAASFPWSLRIVGGSFAKRGSFPWQVMLVYAYSGSHYCGGSILNDRWILTAAHCTNSLGSVNDVLVYVGRHEYRGNKGETAHRVLKIITHPDYHKWNSHKYDIALFWLETAIVYDNLIRPICIPNLNATYDVKPGTICIASGWGSLYPERQRFPDQLSQVRLPIVELSKCNDLYNESLPKNTICAGDTIQGGIDSCVGDSGGPLVCLIDAHRFYQIGVTSFGKGCADKKYPGVYSKVSEYYSWIEKVFADNQPKGVVDDEGSKNSTITFATLPNTTPSLVQTTITSTSTTQTETISKSVTSTTLSRTADTSAATAEKSASSVESTRLQVLTDATSDTSIATTKKSASSVESTRLQAMTGATSQFSFLSAATTDSENKIATLSSSGPADKIITATTFVFSSAVSDTLRKSTNDPFQLQSATEFFERTTSDAGCSVVVPVKLLCLVVCVAIVNIR